MAGFRGGCLPGPDLWITPSPAYPRHRLYDPITGRYTQPAPLKFVDGPSVYEGTSQWMKVDREGHTSLVGEPNSRVWVSDRTLRVYDLNGKASIDVDCPGDHFFWS